MLIRIFPKGPQSEWGWSRTGWSWQDEFCWGGNGFEKGGFASRTWRFSWGADDSSRIHGRVIPIEQIAFLIGTCGKHVGWNEVSCFQTKPTCHGSHLRRLVLVEMPHYTKWPFQWGKMMRIHWHWRYPIFRKTYSMGLICMFIHIYTHMYINIDR